MLPISVSDIVKLLDQIPLWRAIAALPKRLAELESRVAALEGKARTPSAPGAGDCPRCGTPMTFVAEKDHPVFGDIGGLKIHALRCGACGMETEREYSPR